MKIIGAGQNVLIDTRRRDRDTKHLCKQLADELTTRFECGDVFKRTIRPTFLDTWNASSSSSPPQFHNVSLKSRSFDSSETEITTWIEIPICERKCDSPESFHDFSSDPTTEDEDESPGRLKRPNSWSSLTSYIGQEYENPEETNELTTSAITISDDATLDDVTVICKEEKKFESSDSSLSSSLIQDDEDALSDSNTYSCLSDVEYDYYPHDITRPNECVTSFSEKSTKFKPELTIIFEESVNPDARCSLKSILEEPVERSDSPITYTVDEHPEDDVWAAIEKFVTFTQVILERVRNLKTERPDSETHSLIAMEASFHPPEPNDYNDWDAHTISDTSLISCLADSAEDLGAIKNEFDNVHESEEVMDSGILADNYDESEKVVDSGILMEDIETGTSEGYSTDVRPWSDMVSGEIGELSPPAVGSSGSEEGHLWITQIEKVFDFEMDDLCLERLFDEVNIRDDTTEVVEESTLIDPYDIEISLENEELKDDISDSRSKAQDQLDEDSGVAEFLVENRSEPAYDDVIIECKKVFDEIPSQDDSKIDQESDHYHHADDETESISVQNEENVYHTETNERFEKPTRDICDLQIEVDRSPDETEDDTGHPKDNCEDVTTIDHDLVLPVESEYDDLLPQLDEVISVTGEQIMEAPESPNRPFLVPEKDLPILPNNIVDIDRECSDEQSSSDEPILSPVLLNDRCQMTESPNESILTKDLVPENYLKAVGSKSRNDTEGCPLVTTSWHSDLHERDTFDVNVPSEDLPDVSAFGCSCVEISEASGTQFHCKICKFIRESDKCDRNVKKVETDFYDISDSIFLKIVAAVDELPVGFDETFDEYKDVKEIFGDSFLEYMNQYVEPEPTEEDASISDDIENYSMDDETYVCYDCNLINAANRDSSCVCVEEIEQSDLIVERANSSGLLDLGEFFEWNGVMCRMVADDSVYHDEETSLMEDLVVDEANEEDEVLTTDNGDQAKTADEDEFSSDLINKSNQLNDQLEVNTVAEVAPNDLIDESKHHRARNDVEDDLHHHSVIPSDVIVESKSVYVNFDGNIVEEMVSSDVIDQIQSKYSVTDVEDDHDHHLMISNEVIESASEDFIDKNKSRIATNDIRSEWEPIDINFEPEAVEETLSNDVINENESISSLHDLEVHDHQPVTTNDVVIMNSNDIIDEPYPHDVNSRCDNIEEMTSNDVIDENESKPLRSDVEDDHDSLSTPESDIVAESTELDVNSKNDIVEKLFSNDVIIENHSEISCNDHENDFISESINYDEFASQVPCESSEQNATAISKIVEKPFEDIDHDSKVTNKPFESEDTSIDSSCLVETDDTRYITVDAANVSTMEASATNASSGVDSTLNDLLTFMDKHKFFNLATTDSSHDGASAELGRTEKHLQDISSEPSDETTSKVMEYSPPIVDINEMTSNDVEKLLPLKNESRMSVSPPRNAEQLDSSPRDSSNSSTSPPSRIPRKRVAKSNDVHFRLSNRRTRTKARDTFKDESADGKIEPEDLKEYSVKLSLFIEWDNKSSDSISKSSSFEDSLNSSKSISDETRGKRDDNNNHRTVSEMMIDFKNNYPKFILYNDFSPNVKVKRMPKKFPPYSPVKKRLNSSRCKSSPESPNGRYRRYCDITCDLSYEKLKSTKNSPKTPNSAVLQPSKNNPKGRRLVSKSNTASPKDYMKTSTPTITKKIFDKESLIMETLSSTTLSPIVSSLEEFEIFESLLQTEK